MNGVQTSNTCFNPLDASPDICLWQLNGAQVGDMRAHGDALSHRIKFQQV